MGSSARKKKEKAKDFKKPKLRVGKTKLKPDNFTDTSFKSKSIVINQQSLKISAPSNNSQFTHFLSLATSSKNDNQRRDALSYLTTQVSTLPVNHELPLPTSILLPKLLPLILDGSNLVRIRLLKLLRLLPQSDIGDHVECALLYLRAGMTHLSIEIRIDALALLEWLLEVAGEEILSCPGGWVKLLKCFMNIMGWTAITDSSKWISGSNVCFAKIGKAYPKQLHAFAKLIRAGLVESDSAKVFADQKRSERLNRNTMMFPLVDVHLNMIPTVSNAYGHLNLFGTPRDEENQPYVDRRSRQTIFERKFLIGIQTGIAKARKEGGDIGRAAAIVDEALKNGMSDFCISN